MLDQATIQTAVGVLTIVGGVGAWLGRRWTAVRKAVDGMHERVVPAIERLENTMTEVRGASESTLRLSQEALRQAQSAHPRIDGVIAQQQLLALKVERIDERTSLRASGRFRAPEAEGDQG